MHCFLKTSSKLLCDLFRSFFWPPLECCHKGGYFFWITCDIDFHISPLTSLYLFIELISVSSILVYIGIFDMSTQIFLFPIFVFPI